MPSPTDEARAAARDTHISELKATPSVESSHSDQRVDVRVKFKIRGGLYQAFNRDTWQTAWPKHDTMLRLLIWVGIYRKKAGVSRAVIKPIKFVRKGKLYWTRNPDLTDNLKNRVWAFVVNEDGRPRIFDSERDIKDALFNFDRGITLPPESLKSGRNTFHVKVKLKWGRHTFVEKGQVSEVSEPFSIQVP
jgi:hypothetical protein